MILSQSSVHGMSHTVLVWPKEASLQVTLLNCRFHYKPPVCQFEISSTLVLLLCCLWLGLNSTPKILRSQFQFGSSSRSCGLLFCSECSEQAVPIPTEQLYQPGKNLFSYLLIHITPIFDQMEPHPIILQYGSVTAATSTSLACLFPQGVCHILSPPIVKKCCVHLWL